MMRGRGDGDRPTCDSGPRPPAQRASRIGRGRERIWQRTACAAGVLLLGVHPGEGLAVNRLEAKLVTGESFRDFAPASLLNCLRVETMGKRARLVAPGHGGELVEVLRDYAVYAQIDPDDAVVALALAEGVEALIG